MSQLRNIGWGLFVAFWCMGTMLLGVGLVALLGAGAEMSAEIRELGGFWIVLGGYVAAAGAAGIVLGLLRPLIAHPLGVYVVGGSVASAGFVALFVVWTRGNGESFSPGLIAAVAPVFFVVGAAFTPLIRRGPPHGGSWYPDPARLLARLRHTESSPPEDEKRPSNRGSV